MEKYLLIAAGVITAIGVWLLIRYWNMSDQACVKPEINDDGIFKAMSSTLVWSRILDSWRFNDSAIVNDRIKAKGISLANRPITVFVFGCSITLQPKRSNDSYLFGEIKELKLPAISFVNEDELSLWQTKFMEALVDVLYVTALSQFTKH